MIKRKVTVGFIPNAIQIVADGSSYQFASFLKRDSAFEQMMSLWKQCNVDSYFAPCHRGQIDEMKIEKGEQFIANPNIEIVKEKELISKNNSFYCDHDHSKYNTLCVEVFEGNWEHIWGLLFSDKLCDDFSKIENANEIPFLDWYMIHRRGMTIIMKTNWKLEDREWESPTIGDISIGATRTLQFDVQFGIQTARFTNKYTVISKTMDSICVKSVSTTFGVPFTGNYQTWVTACIKKLDDTNTSLIASFYVEIDEKAVSIMKAPIQSAIKSRIIEYYLELVEIIHDVLGSNSQSAIPEVILEAIPPVESKQSISKAEYMAEFVNQKSFPYLALVVVYTLILLQLLSSQKKLENELMILKFNLNI